MPDAVIPDTSCLIIFDKIGRLEILKEVYGRVCTTPEISQEFVKPLPGWIQLIEVRDKKYLNFLETRVDIGEASAIALAAETDNSLLILDDLKARKLAEQLVLVYTGTLGVIAKAKQKGLIRKIKPVIDELRQTDFRISEKVIDYLLTSNNE